MSDSMQSSAQPPAGRPVPAMVAIALAAAFLLCGYEFVRSVSNSLYIGAYGADRLPLIMALMPLGVLLSLYVYGLLLSRFGPARALFFTSGLSAAVLLACYWGVLPHAVLVAGKEVMRPRWAPAAGILYILREAYIVVVLEQYWSLINSTLSPALAKRFNGPITGIASLGSIVGAGAVGRFAVSAGSETFLLFAAASLLPAAICSWLAYRWAGEPRPAPEEAGGRQGHLALGLFRRSPYLLLFAALIAITQVLSTALDLRFSGLAEEAFPVKDERTAYFGHFWFTLNIAASVLQFVVAPALLHLAPLRLIHTAIPCVHLATGLALLLHPSLRTGAAALFAFKALDYSLFRSGKEIFYIPLSFDARYRAKEVIDAFVYRFSKGGLGLLLEVSRRAWGAVPGHWYPVFALVAAGLWLPVVWRLTGDAKAGAAGGDPERG